MSDTLYKALGPDRTPIHGGSGRWPEPGAWRTVEGPLEPCRNGLHVVTVAQLLDWLGDEVWEVEVRGERIDQYDKSIVREARLVRRTAWDARRARLFAADCAEHVLHLFEDRYPDDDRPRRAIEAARAHADGRIDDDARFAARFAAESAAWEAAWEAARFAAESAAESAAWDAARFAAWDAARSAEREWRAARLAWYLGGDR